MDDLRAMLKPSLNGEGGPPLAVLYSQCHAVHSQQDQILASRDFDLIGSALALLGRTQSAIEAMGVFSANEDSDDLATADIKYLLVPFYLGSLLSAAPVRTDSTTGVSAARLAAVNQAAAALGTFLQRCEQYDLLGALGRTAFDAMATAVDPAAKRAFKVEKFKREKALNAGLGALEARRLSAAAQEREDEAGATAGGGGRGGGATGSSASALAAATAAAVGASVGGDGGAGLAGGGGGGGGGGPLDEEDERQLWVWRVELAALQALDVQASMKQEVELLQHAAAREAAAAAAGPGPSSGDARIGGTGGRSRGGEGPGPCDDQKAELMAKLRAICRDLDGNRREQIRQNVFKPGHTLPTMTVEEAGEIEMREAAEREERQRRQAAKEGARRAELDSDEEDAEEKERQRAFDDWRDAHPKGYGNSKLRPCG